MFAIGEASRRSGVGIETIRYYEREGIVPAPERTASNRRVYSPQDVGRLRLLRRCRDLGFPLADARRLLEISEGRAGDCETVRAAAEAHIITLGAKVAELQRMVAALRELKANCDGDSVACPLLQQLRTSEAH